METIKLEHIAKIEGHASLEIKVENGKVEKCNLLAIEGARFFEGLLKGHPYDEAYEITSRICGICSCGHVVTSLKAMERAMGVKVTPQTDILREAMTIGERIRSHAAHLYLLALPDYLGYESALAMAPKYKEEVMRALRLIKLGNNIVAAIGGREMHPFTSVVGGFTSVPKPEVIKDLLKRLREAREDAIAMAKLFLSIDYPDFKNETEYLSLKQTGKFPLVEGKLVSNKGANFEQNEYTKYVQEYLEDYATSKFAVRDGKPYMTGPLSRMNNNVEMLTGTAKKMLDESKFKFPSTNPFHSNVCQALEEVFWVEKLIELFENYEFKFEGLPKVNVRAGHGMAAVEVPRGLCFHEYEVDAKGKIIKANIMTPTCQNLRNMEKDIRAYLPSILHLPRDKVVIEIEKLIRAYDPCFSCSTHFLKVKWL